MVYVLFGEGFEEIEAVAPLKLLRRADIKVAAVSITRDLLVRGGHGLAIRTDITLEQVDFEALEMLVLPGGGGGVASIEASPAAMNLIRLTWEAHKLVAAICAAPSLLAELNVLNGKRIVCHPTVADKVEAAGGELQPGLKVVRDDNLITGMAAGASIEFGLELVAALRSRAVAEEMRCGIFY